MRRMRLHFRSRLRRSLCDRRPVFNLKPRNAPEFAHVVGCQDVTTRQGDPRNQHIVGAYPFAPSFQVRPDGAGSLARDLVQLHQLEGRAKLSANYNAFLRSPAAQRAKHQLGNRHSREKDRTPISGSQLFGYMDIAPSQQLDCDVRVKQIGRHKLARFSIGGWAGRSSSGRLPISLVNNSAGQPCWTASSTTPAGTAGCKDASPRAVCERSWTIRATSSTCSGRSLLSSEMTCSTDAMLLPYANRRRKSTALLPRTGDTPCGLFRPSSPDAAC